MDNIVWLYSKIIDYKLDVDASVLVYLENEFYKYFRVIYSDHMSMGYLRHISRKSKNYFDSANTEFNINTYYNAWKLRGDNPIDYINGYYECNHYTDVWEWNSENRIYPEDKTIRKSAAVAFLYHTYHYNSAVKMAGNEKIRVTIPSNLVAGIEQVQEKLQQIIAYKGICIEVNPSSNCLIGPFGKFNYEKHPILEFYNIGLEKRYKDTDDSCNNISVCINTDDQSIFKTSLENEYAFMVRALENEKNDDGTHKYGRASIYDWIDNIRRMGIEYSFEPITLNRWR